MASATEEEDEDGGGGGGGGVRQEKGEEVSLCVIMTNRNLPYFPCLFTFQLAFLPYFLYHFTIFFHIF